MATNSITGRFRDIEVSFSANGPRILMSLENLAAHERSVRVMYQRLPISGRANWTDFHLTDEKESAVMPTDVMQAYRLTFFVDDDEPISTHIEKIVEELERLRSEVPEPQPEPEPTAPVAANQARVPTPPMERDADEKRPGPVPRALAAVPQDDDATPERAATPPVEEEAASLNPSAPGYPSHASPVAEAQVTSEPEAVPQSEPTTVPQKGGPRAAVEAAEISNSRETGSRDTVERAAAQFKEASAALAAKPATVNRVDTLQETNFGFQISIPSLPPSAIAARKKTRAAISIGATSPVAPVQKGVFGNIVQVLGISAGGRRNKAYYQEEGERVQNELHDRIAKLEKDYEDGCGLVLENWDADTLSQEETAVFLLNLMVSEIAAWRKEAKQEALVETLADIEATLKQTLKQTRGASVPSPTVFAAGPVADNERDLEKIRNECNGYIQGFTKKLANLEKNHAAKVEILPFKKFLVEFVRDVLFLNVAKCTHPAPVPKRLGWFLELMGYEVMPIEIGVTKVSSRHHKLKGASTSEFESGTIIEVITPGLQSTDGHRVIQTAVVIQSQ